MRRRDFLKGSVSVAALFASNRADKTFGNYLSGNKNKEDSTVVTVRGKGATRWDWKSYPYVDHIDEARVEEMLKEGILALTGALTPKEAWAGLFPGFKKGQKIAIKPNFNDLYDGFRGMVATPIVLRTLVRGLIANLGVPAGDICVYDCTRPIPDEYRERVGLDINYIEGRGSSLARKIEYRITGNPLAQGHPELPIPMSGPVLDKEGNPITCLLPRIISEAAHIINIPILKTHQFISHSGALKNHYGTVRFSDGHGFPEYLHPPIIHSAIADINAHPALKEKTRLVVMDALFGRMRKRGGPPERWTTFDGRGPEYLLLSQNGVSLDSVALHLLKKEARARNEELLPDDFLRIAHQKGLGFYEDPGQNGFKRIKRISREV